MDSKEKIINSLDSVRAHIKELNEVENSLLLNKLFYDILQMMNYHMTKKNEIYKFFSVSNQIPDDFIKYSFYSKSENTVTVRKLYQNLRHSNQANRENSQYRSEFIKLDFLIDFKEPIKITKDTSLNEFLSNCGSHRAQKISQYVLNFTLPEKINDTKVKMKL